MSDAADAHGHCRGVAFVTLGCKVNRAESDTIAAHLHDAGALFVAEEDAAVIVINTCTVTGEADRKVRKAVRHALGHPGAPVVVATGCLATLDAAGLTTLGERVVVEADKQRVALRVTGLLGLSAAHVAAAEDPGDAGRGIPLQGRDRDGYRMRVSVKIEDGCDAFCTYCIVPYARGGPRSVALAEVVAEVEELVAAGVGEIVLTGINLGRYRDEGARAGLPEVISAVAATGVPRIRLSSIEPGDLTPSLLEVLAATTATCRHLHVPLQSGSDAVLAAMDRPYTVAGYARRLAEARAALPGLAVTTDVIAGFPGESDVEAAETRETIRTLGFARLHVFRFSPRAGTAAATMSGHVDPAVVSRRARELRALDAAARRAHAVATVGSTVEVLVENVIAHEHGVARASGTTREYLTLQADGCARSPGDIALARVIAVDGSVLLGEWA